MVVAWGLHPHFTPPPDVHAGGAFEWSYPTADAALAAVGPHNPADVTWFQNLNEMVDPLLCDDATHVAANSRVVIFKTAHFFFPFLARNSRYRDAITRVFGTDAIADVHALLFNPAPHVRREIETVARHFGGKYVIGLQIRVNDECEGMSLRDEGGVRRRVHGMLFLESEALFGECAEALGRTRRGNFSIFVASDSAEKKAEVVRRFGAARVLFFDPRADGTEVRNKMEVGEGWSFNLILGWGRLWRGWRDC
jgi:hypothetical protein